MRCLTIRMFHYILTFLFTISVVKSDPFPPSFSENIFILAVPEDQPIISQLFVITASDVDLPLVFEQISTFSEFEVMDNGVLNLIGSLDRESIPSYKMSIRVTDSTGLFSSTIIFIAVTDVNDNSPVFSNTVLQHTLAENTDVGTQLFSVSATDLDSGSNGFITFSLSDNPDNTFSISDVIGTFSLHKPLNFEQTTHYHVVVVATDSGTNPLSVQTSISITVTDSDDLTPVFDMTSYYVAIDEHSTSTSVVTVLAIDSDQGVGHTIHYDISGGNDGNAFSIGTITGTIAVQLSNAIDRESHPNPFILTVRAFEAQNAVQSTFVLVTIELLDINDQQPVFIGGPFSAEVPENSPIGYSVVTSISASDEDLGDNALFSFRIDSNTDPGVFTINSQNGEVIVSGGLDRELQASYTFDVVVFDTNGAALSSITSVTITVTDVNDNSPVFTSDSFLLSVLEEQATGLFIATITADDVDAGDSGIVSYALTGLYADRFQVDTGGVISTQSVLDREEISSYEINLLASDMDPINPRQTVTLLIISVGDVNDQNPFFTPLVLSVSVIESVSLPHQLITVFASDNDIGTNADVSFSLVVSSNIGSHFDITSDTGLVSVINPLDRETNSEFTLLVVATDSGGRSGTGTVLVTVTDANTQNPVFSTSLYQAIISENSPVDTSVLQVSASDTDTGVNAVISFSLLSSTDGSYFKMDSRDGHIYVANFLDAETQLLYTFEVVAEDNGVPPRSATSQVQITITDTNDNSPVFSSSLLVFSVPENSATSATIQVVTATDADIDTTNNQLTYSILSQTPNQNKFSILPESGALIVKTPLDREDTIFYTVLVECVDIGGLSDTITLQITVTDINDNPPLIQDVYTFDYLENDVIGTKLGTVTATDRDEFDTPNSQLAFSIIGGDTTFFSIDTSSGEIVSAQEIDRETTQSLTLTIIVSDNGTPELSDTSIVNINIVDVNDNSPVFGATSYLAYVLEGSNMGHIVSVVSAIDEDEGDNGVIQFKITGGDVLGHFSIDPATGEISTTSLQTDRETISGFSLTVSAIDTGIPPRQTTTNVVVVVNDTNDNKPIFTQTAFFIEINEAENINKVVVVLLATDVDLLLSGTVLYEMVTATSLFAVDSTSGEVTLTSSLDRELTDNHVIEIQAVDQSMVPLSSDANVVITISVTDANDHPPLFTPQPVSPISVSEGVSVGFVLETYTATDEDTGANSVVTFALSGGQGGFEIDRVTGQLIISSQLDRETRDSYMLEILAVDGGANPLSATATVVVIVSDTNDNAPIFTPNTPLSVNIRENLDIGQSVTTLTATDTDLGANQLLVYSITNSKPNSGLNTFRIDQSSGQITVNENNIDRELVDRYVLSVQVVDSGVLPLSDTTELEVLVVDVNDENPTFSQSVYTETILESRGVNTVVLVVSASDNDASENNQITYSITGPESVKFQIDSENGEIITTDTFDFEVKFQYVFTVTGSDNGNVMRQGTAEVRVTIADTNDNHPILEPSVFTTQLLENVLVPTVVLTVTATDRDSTVNSVVKFEKTSGSADFLIDYDSGSVIVARSLDREMTSSYSITVKGVDQGSPKLDSEPLVIEIEVLDVNDNHPVFVSPVPSNVSIPEDTPVATVVAVVIASDNDNGLNGEVIFILIGSDLFEIGTITGEIRVAGELDRETMDYFQLTVISSDKGIPLLTAQTILHIYVTDVNDNSPTFNTSIDTTVSIREDTFIGQTILHTSVTDTDIFPNNIITFKLTLSDPITGLTTFGVDENTGVLFIAINNTDRELTPLYVLRIEASDGGVPVLTANLTVLVVITDFNDNIPVFTQDTFSISISESTSVQSSIFRFSATDGDEGVNKEFEFSIQDSLRANFSVDTSSGDLFTLNRFDFEKESFYTFVVIVADHGVPLLTSERIVSVYILDDNDNSPILSDTIYRKGLLEDFSVGQTVFKFNATDRDSGLYGQVYFQLIGEFSDFEVDLVSGILSTTGLFSGQLGRTLDFQIRAFDNMGAVPSLFDLENVHIVILTPDYIVEMILNRSPDYVTTNQHDIEHIFTQAVGVDVVIDEVSPFYDSLNLIDPSSSTVNIHATHLTTKTLIDGEVLLKGVDENEHLINTLLFTAGVQLAEPVVPKDTTLVSTELALIIVSSVLLLFVSCCGCVLCLLLIRLYRLRRRKREYAKSYASLSTFLPSHGNISSPTDMHSLTNPLYISPYDNSSYLDNPASIRYESQELTMELFTQDFESFGGDVSMVDLFGVDADGVDSVSEVSKVLVDYVSEDGSGISVI